MKLESTTAAILAASAAPAAGPTVIALLGYDVPVLSALFGVLGVVLSLELAPPPPRPLSTGQRWALRIVLTIFTLALIIYDQKDPLTALGWAIGLGFSGYTAIELIGSLVPERLRELMHTVFGGPKAPTAPTNDSPEEPQ